MSFSQFDLCDDTERCAGESSRDADVQLAVSMEFEIKGENQCRRLQNSYRSLIFFYINFFSPKVETELCENSRFVFC